MTCFDKSTREGGLFSGYIDMFINLKTTYSGFPGWCKTASDKEQYIQKYYKQEGVLLDIDKISKNAGYRSLAKLLLNSLWGALV